jgi:hypothetical protein
MMMHCRRKKWCTILAISSLILPYLVRFILVVMTLLEDDLHCRNVLKNCRGNGFVTISSSFISYCGSAQLPPSDIEAES